MNTTFMDAKYYTGNNGGEAQTTTIYGLTRQGEALIAERVLMTERHLHGGSGGGMSKARLKDERGQPKMVLRLRLVHFCRAHQVAYENGSCPECADS